jgi:type IV pilus assembly protein PilC
MAYHYVAYTPQGAKVQGRIEAPSEAVAEGILWKQEYTIISLKEAVESRSSTFGGRVRTRDLIVFSQQLATLIESGIPIVRGLHLLGEQISNKHFKAIVIEIVADVQQGRFFSEAILKHGSEFPDLYGRLVEVGERAGNLELVLRRLASYMESEEALKQKIRKAMAYPTFVMVMAIGVVFLMSAVALPPLMSMFTSFDAELPVPTKILLAVTDFMALYKFHVLGAMLLSVISVVVASKTVVGKAFLDRLVLRIPIVNAIIIQGAVARFCQSTATLLQAGIALPEILEMIIRTQGNVVLATALSQVHSQMLQGQGLADPLSQQKVFPNMLNQMVRVGEETGSLDSNLQTLAKYYEEEVDRSVTALTGVLEPAMTIFIGVMVGAIAAAVIMPMYSLMGSIQ